MRTLANVLVAFQPASDVNTIFTSDSIIIGNSYSNTLRTKTWTREVNVLRTFDVYKYWTHTTSMQNNS